MTAPDAPKPHLSQLVRAGDAQAEAIAITDFVFMAYDISNAYLVTTGDGDVVINTGFPDNAERTAALLGAKRTGPLRRIILTQSHADHFGGLDALKEPETQVIVQAGFTANLADMMSLQPFFGPRTRKLWGSTLKRPARPPAMPQVTPDVLVDRHLAFEQGGRRFELIHTPDGETTDSLSVWLPDDRILFTGNLFGPVFLSMPFLNTLRGDKPRLVRTYLASLERVRALGAEILVTGHGDPIRGAERIRADLDRLHAAVSWVRDYTLEGMRAGKDVHTLMREVTLPDEIAIGEFHGKVAWAVKSIWREYAGWLHYEEGTTALYGVPRSSVNADLADLAGGPDALVARAAAKVADDRPLEAIHLLDIALAVAPDHAAGLAAKRDALTRLLDASGGTNLSETMWLRSELAEVEALLAPARQGTV